MLRFNGVHFTFHGGPWHSVGIVQHPLGIRLIAEPHAAEVISEAEEWDIALHGIGDSLFQRLVIAIESGVELRSQSWMHNGDGLELA